MPVVTHGLWVSYYRMAKQALEVGGGAALLGCARGHKIGRWGAYERTSHDKGGHKIWQSRLLRSRSGTHKWAGLRRWMAAGMRRSPTPPPTSRTICCMGRVCRSAYLQTAGPSGSHRPPTGPYVTSVYDIYGFIYLLLHTSYTGCTLTSARLPIHLS